MYSPRQFFVETQVKHRHVVLLLESCPTGVPMQTERAIVQVASAVILRGDRFLVCRRPIEKRHGGMWEFPGGKCERGESIEATLRRELREELDLKVVGTGEPEFAMRDPGSSFLISFVPVRVEGEPKCHEHIGLRWETLSELSKLELAPCDRQYAEIRLKRSAPKIEGLREGAS